MEEIKAQHKFKSRKFLFTAWGATLATFLSLFSIKTGYDASWMPGTMALLVGIVTSYVAVGSVNAKKEDKK